MNEALLHFVWQHLAFDARGLKDTDGNEVRILKQGRLNRNAGPDFDDARIGIGEAIWAGQVEIHLRSSDWYRHGHQNDPAYETVILHVVYRADGDVRTPSGHLIPTVELDGRVPLSLIRNFDYLSGSKGFLKCAHGVGSIEPFVLESFRERVMASRLEERRQGILALLFEMRGDWEQTALIWTGRYFGLPVNKEPFEALCRTVPTRLIWRFKADPQDLEALFLGQAGLLRSGITDEYGKDLERRYDWIRKVHSLPSVSPIPWKLLRMRPASFPTIRIAQFTAFLAKAFPLMDRFIRGSMGDEVLDEICAGSYWDTHYLLGRDSGYKKKFLGKAVRAMILMNAAVPLIYTHRCYYGANDALDECLDLLRALRAENNRVTRKWEAAGITMRNAFDTQATLQIHNDYCRSLLCLQCPVGYSLLKGARSKQ